jgi:hypothetical protein
MKPDLRDPRTRHLLTAALILLVGLVAAVAIFVRAGSAPETLLELSPETSKKYLRDLEMYGGTANVLSVQLTAWFESLWHGRRLAYTTAVLSVLCSLAYLFFTVVLPPAADVEPSDPDAPGPGR